MFEVFTPVGFLPSLTWLLLVELSSLLLHRSREHFSVTWIWDRTNGILSSSSAFMNELLMLLTQSSFLPYFDMFREDNCCINDCLPSKQQTKKLITQSLTVIMILIYHFYSCANRPMIFFLFLMSSWFALSSQITIRNTNGEMLSPLLTSSNWKRRYSTNNSTSIQRIHQLYIIKSIWAENNFIILLIVAFHLIILKPQCSWARLGRQCTIIETLWINCIFITGSLIWLLSEHSMK